MLLNSILFSLFFFKSLIYHEVNRNLWVNSSISLYASRLNFWMSLLRLLVLRRHPCIAYNDSRTIAIIAQNLLRLLANFFLRENASWHTIYIKKFCVKKIKNYIYAHACNTHTQTHTHTHTHTHRVNLYTHKIKENSFYQKCFKRKLYDLKKNK